MQEAAYYRDYWNSCYDSGVHRNKPDADTCKPTEWHWAKIPYRQPKWRTFDVDSLSIDPSKPARFGIDVNSHSVELDFDPARVSTLIVGGNELKPAKWKVSDLGGHHMSGILTFPLPASSLEQLNLFWRMPQVRTGRSGGMLNNNVRWDVTNEYCSGKRFYIVGQRIKY